MIFEICSRWEFCREIARSNEKEKVEYEWSEEDFKIFEKKKEMNWIEDMKDIRRILTRSTRKKEKIRKLINSWLHVEMLNIDA